MRAFSCGITWMVIGIVAYPEGQKLQALMMPLAFVLLFPINLLVVTILKFIKLGGVFELARIIFSVAMFGLGDLWLFLLSLINEKWVPLGDPPIFSSCPVWFIVRADEYAIANELQPR